MRPASPSETVLITGIDGFTGRYLEPLLEEAGYRVFGTVQGRPERENHLACELTDPVSVRKVVEQVRPARVVHLAAVSFVPHGTGLEIYDVNLFGALHLLDALAAMETPPAKTVLASTATVYGNREGMLDETLCPDPVNHYAMSKLAMEKMARNYEGKMAVTVARPFNYTGAGQADHFLVPKIAAHYRERKPVLELGNLDVARDFGDVRDAAEAYRLLLESGVPGEAYNICTGRAVPLAHLLETAGEVTGHRPEIRVNPAFVRANEIKTLCGDNGKLKALGWAPAHTVEETLEWMLS